MARPAALRLEGDRAGTLDAAVSTQRARAWDAHLVHRGLPRPLPELLRAAGVALARVAIVPLLNVGGDPETYSGGMRGLIDEFVNRPRDR